VPALIQVLLHRREDLMAAARLASDLDKGANRRQVETLQAKIVRGAEIDLFLDCPDLMIDKPTASLVWTGNPERAVFEVELAHDVASTVMAKVFLSIDGMPIGEISFTLHVQRAREQTLQTLAADDHAAQLVGDTARRYRSAFISYARGDFEQVSYFAQGLEQHEMDLFVDVTKAEPGEDWSGKLTQEINRADVFYLMWSSSAARSPWVDKEARHAVARSQKSNRPVIVPMTLHRGAPPPPPFLHGYEFNSKWLAQREAQKVPIFSAPPNRSDTKPADRSR
jgi:TIR domain